MAKFGQNSDIKRPLRPDITTIHLTEGRSHSEKDSCQVASSTEIEFLDKIKPFKGILKILTVYTPLKMRISSKFMPNMGGKVPF